jgi:hypothetical protein
MTIIQHKHWTCKHQCGFHYESAIPLTAMAHNCSKKKANIECIPVKSLGDADCFPSKKRVASSRTTNTQSPQSSREDIDMGTKRAEPAVPKAPAKKAAAAKPVKPAPAEAEKTKQGRRSFGGRGWLAVEIDKVIRKTPDEQVTVGSIVKKITNSQGEHPSTGAVAACIARWGEQGYIKVKHDRPMSFNGFTAKWKDSNLDAFLEAEKAKRAKARAAAKAA